MAEALYISPRVEIPEGELSWRFSASGGPGGQSVNTSNTRVELSFDLANSKAFPAYLHQRALTNLSGRLVDGVITMVASEHRSQLQNRSAAARRLKEVLAGAIAPPPPARRPTKPTKSSQRVRVDDKKRRGDVKKHRQNPGLND